MIFNTLIKKSEISERSEYSQDEIVKILVAKGNNTTFVNPHSYLILRGQTNLLDIFDYILSDGILVTKLLNILLNVNRQRLSFDFSSLAKQVLESASKNGLSVYFIGASESAIEKFIVTIKIKYQNIILKGFRNGYFNNKEELNLSIREIVQLKPDIVIVGMGSGKQEEYINELLMSNYKGATFTCGAFIEQSSEKLEFYPSLINKFHLRWLFRIYHQPSLLSRYIFRYPLFVLIFFYDYYQLRKSGK